MSVDRSGAHIYGTEPNLDLQYEWAGQTEEKFNCSIKIISYSHAMKTSHERLATEVLAGIHTSDIFTTAPLYGTPTLMTQGLVYPLSDYLDFDANPLFADPMIKNSVTYAGKQWGFLYGEPSTNTAFVYNLDIRDRDGLEDPLELAAKGQWTWEKSVEVLQNATKDFNGDGIIDQWGLDEAQGGKPSRKGTKLFILEGVIIWNTVRIVRLKKEYLCLGWGVCAYRWKSLCRTVKQIRVVLIRLKQLKWSDMPLIMV